MAILGVHFRKGMVKAMHRRLLALTLTVLIISTILLPIYAWENRPVIDITPPPSRSFPLKVYVYPKAYDVDNEETFTCQYQDKLVAIFYDVLRSFRKVVLRFVDEYPEYSRLLEITFVNVSSLDHADVAFRVIRQENVNPYTDFTGAWTPYRSRINILCNLLSEESEEEVWSVVFHELLHALGLGHARQQFTDQGHPELMLYIPSGTKERIWPSTLDLYGLYELYFNHKFREVYENTSLPPNIEYKMVIPYDVEIQRLEEENRWLWEKLKDANDLISYFRNESDRLRLENERLREVVQDLDIKLQLMQQVLDRCQADRERLDERVTELEDKLETCHNLGLELARKCNETIKGLVTKYNSLKENYSLCLDYLRQYREACEAALEETQFRYRILIYLEAAIAMAIIFAIYVYARKHGIS